MQSFNFASIGTTLRVLLTPSLAVPHIIVSDIRSINWFALRRHFHHIAFDKDNTLTAPYAPTLHPPFHASMDACISSFGRDNIVVVSNSAGCDDPGYREVLMIRLTTRQMSLNLNWAFQFSGIGTRNRWVDLSC
jgi:phosphatidylglycerophosphatase GEP4